MKKEIWLDMDGTIADLYGVDNWLEYLEAEDEKPYRIAKPLVNMENPAKELRDCKARLIGIIIGWQRMESQNTTTNKDKTKLVRRTLERLS